MSGVICECGKASNEPRRPVCEKPTCPGRETFAKFNGPSAQELFDRITPAGRRALEEGTGG